MLVQIKFPEETGCNGFQQRQITFNAFLNIRVLNFYCESSSLFVFSPVDLTDGCSSKSFIIKFSEKFLWFRTDSIFELSSD